MTKPRTTAQRYADYKRTFPKKVNDRRCELIDKELSDNSPAALTNAELDELAELTRIVDEWQAKSPWAIDQKEFMDEQNPKFHTTLERVRRKGASHE